MSNVTQLRIRKPSGKPGWPRLLLTGAEGSWKSGTAAMLSADERIGRMFWLEVGDGETTADEYGAFDGVSYEILDHDGTWLDIYNQISAAWVEAKQAEEDGELPVALAVDAMSGIWSMLMDMGDARARKKAAGGTREAKSGAVAWSADYEATITPDLWGLIKKRHSQLMGKILTWPGPVVLVSRERVATVFENGNPTSRKDWSLECRKDLPSQVTAWVRLEGGGAAHVLKLRSAKAGMSVMPDQDRSQKVNDFTVARLIFDWVGCEVGVSKAARMVQLDADQDMPDEVTDTSGPSNPSPANGRPASHQRPNGNGRAQRQATVNVLQVASRGVDAMIAASNQVEARRVADYATTCAAATVDVSGFLTNAADSAAVARLEQVRENLGIIEGEPVTLADFGALVASYWETHGRPVDSLPDAPAAAEAPAVAEDAAA